MHPRFQTAFGQLADNLQSALAPILADEHFPAMLTAEQVSTLKRESGLDEDALAFALLPLAAACARTDLSHFNVGAIARGISGACISAGDGVPGRDDAANRSCRAKRDRPRLAAR